MSKLGDYARNIVSLAKELEKNPSNEKIKADIETFNNILIAEIENKKMPEPKLSELPDKFRAVKTRKEALSKELKKQYLGEIGLEEEFLEGFIKPEKEIKPTKEIEYTVYETTKFGMTANRFCEKIGIYLTSRYPEMFQSVYKALKLSSIKILSKTYVNILIFSGISASAIVLFCALIISLLLGINPIGAVARAFAFSLIAGIAVCATVYFYPSIVVGAKRKAIKNDLPFVILHMAAVAGSGAQPISIFNLVLSSGEYKGLEPEIKKIVNYVNLFGYDLSTALKAVAGTTPSPEFKELLTGITSSIETGGDLKSYLKGKAEDTINTYQLDRKKNVENLATYSDVYTGVLIAAPLLFSVTLAIINMIGGQIGGFSVRTIALAGVYGAIPLLNIGFIIFLNSIQPGT